MQKHTLGEFGTERSFDGKLCQKYLYQKLLKSGNWFSVQFSVVLQSKMSGMFFKTQCILLISLNKIRQPAQNILLHFGTQFFNLGVCSYW